MRQRILLPALMAAALLSGGCGDDDSELVEGQSGAAVGTDPVLMLADFKVAAIGVGFNVDEDSPGGDPDPDNALGGLGAVVNPELDKALADGLLIFLLRFSGMSALPAAGEFTTVTLEGFLGIDQDEDPTNNADPDQQFAIDPTSFDDQGRAVFRFDGVRLEGQRDGTALFAGGPSSFRAEIPILETVLPATVEPGFTRGMLSVDASGRMHGEGVMGGVVPAAVLAQPLLIDEREVVPLLLIARLMDVDLNGDGMLDTTADASNPDGLSAALEFTGVPSGLVTP